MRGLKSWVLKHLPFDSRLREVILLDKDSLTHSEFLVKLDVWLKLYNIENQVD